MKHNNNTSKIQLNLISLAGFRIFRQLNMCRICFFFFHEGEDVDRLLFFYRYIIIIIMIITLLVNID